MLPTAQTLKPQRENFNVELKLVLGVDGTRCRLGSSYQINFPLGEVNAPPLGVGIIGARGFDEPLLPRNQAHVIGDQACRRPSGPYYNLVIADVRVTLWLDEIRQTLL